MPSTDKKSFDDTQQQCDWEITSVCSECMTDFSSFRTSEIGKYSEKDLILFVYIRCRVDDFVIVYCRFCYNFLSHGGTFHKTMSLCCGKCLEVDKISPATNILKDLY